VTFRVDASENLWQEVSVASILRALCPSPFAALKSIPIPAIALDDDETAFILSHNFFNVHNSSKNILVLEAFATNVVDQIVQATEAHFYDYCRFRQAAIIFSKLAQSDTVFTISFTNALKCMGEMDHVIACLDDASQTNPGDAKLHIAYAEALLAVEQYAQALDVARKAVKLDPASTAAWLLLSRIYVEANAYDLAMIALNVTPAEKEIAAPVLGIPKTAAGKTEPAMRYLPEEPAEAEDEETCADDEELAQLPASKLSGIDIEAYDILVRIHNRIGWDEMLDIRSRTFLMEEEVPAGAASTTAAELGQGTGTGAEAVAEQDVEAACDTHIPDLHKDLHRDPYSMEAPQNNAPFPPGNDVDTPSNCQDLLANKRLCSRWLDFLFSALYADLKAYTEWTIEEENARAVGRLGKVRSQADWQNLGKLAERMIQLQEAEMAYRNCVREKFQPEVWERLMWMYTNAEYMNEPLICAAQLCNYHILHLHEQVDPVKKEAPPVEVQKALCKVTSYAGLSKVCAAFDSLDTGSIPPMMYKFVDECKSWEVYNYDC